MFKHDQQRFGERNCIEQWFGLLKRRTRGFCNNINAKSIDSGIKRLEEWTGSFAVITDLLGYLNSLVFSNCKQYTSPVFWWYENKHYFNSLSKSLKSQQ